jgi:type I restriction enzyme, S subunit
MSESKKLIPKRRFKGFIEDWILSILGISKDVRDGTHDSPSYYKKGFPLITSKNLTDSGLDMDNVSLISQSDFDKINKRSKVDSGDILFGMIGTIGNPVLVNQDNFAIKNVALIKEGGEILNIFLLQVFKSQIFDKYINSQHVGNTQKFLALSKIRELSLFIPSIKEQTQIGEFFKKLDNLITTQQKKLEKAKTLKLAYLTEMFPNEGELKPRIRFNNFNNNWESLQLGQIGSTYTGLSGKTRDDFGHGNAEFVTYMNIYNNPIADLIRTEPVEIDDKQNQVMFGDVFFTTSSETPHEVGLSSIWLGNKKNVYLNSFCFGFRPNINIEPYYFAFMLRSPSMRKKFRLLAQGISRYNISKNRVMKLHISNPHITEQTKIGNFFKLLDHKIALEQKKLNKLKNIKQAYLNEMFV